MIHLLYTLIFSEMVIILILLFKTPLRKLVIISLDKLKRGKAPIMVKTVAATICALFASNCFTMKKIGERVDETGMVNPTDQVLLARTLLEASLMVNDSDAPLRKLVIISLDKLKRGKAPIMVKTVAATICALFASNCFTMKKIGERVDETGMVNPTDQVLLARTLLEASLMGFLLFLALMIDRLHHYIRELRQLRKTMEAAKKQNRSFEDLKSAGCNGNIGDGKSVGDEITNLKTKIKDLESECERKARELKSAESNVEALKNQTDGFIAEHGRLLEDNQNLRNQLQSLDH